MNTNDFSACKIGDVLWSIELGKCIVKKVDIDSASLLCESLSTDFDRYSMVYYFNGKRFGTVNQLLFFSKPEIIAPAKSEPLRLECYCWWTDVPMSSYEPYPIFHDFATSRDVRKFVGKRTRMTLEEI